MATRKSRKFRSIIEVLFAFLIVLVIAVYSIGWLISVDWRTLRPDVRAEEGTIETAYLGTGLALREELVLNAPLSGELDLVAPEGLRVPVGKLLAIVTNREAVALLSKEKESLERRLDDLAARNPFNKATGLGANPTEISPEETKIRERLAQLEKELATCERRIVAPTAGEVAFMVDGLESPGPGVAIKNLLSVEKPLASFPRLPTKPTPTAGHRLVELDKPLLKIIDTLQFWIVVDLPPEAQVSQGQKVKVRFSGKDSSLWEARVENTVKQSEFLRTVLFFPDYQPFFTSLRWVDLTVLTEYYEGIRIPVKALHQDDAGYSVYLRGFGGVVSKPVQVVGQNAEYAIVHGLAEGSQVIL